MFERRLGVLPRVFAQRHTFTCSRRIHYVRESATRARECFFPRGVSPLSPGSMPLGPSCRLEGAGVLRDILCEFQFFEMNCPRPLNLVWQGPGPDETNFCREPQAPRGQEHYRTVPIRVSRPLASTSVSLRGTRTYHAFLGR